MDYRLMQFSGNRSKRIKLRTNTINRTKYDLRKFFFTNRVVNMWNSFPNSVLHAESTDICLRNDLINFGVTKKQEVIYNYHSEIQRTGSRSVIN